MINVVDSIIVKSINHGELNPNNRNTLLRSIMTVLAYLNSVFSNRSLIQFVDQFLAENPTNEGLQTKSLCLLLISFRQGLEYYITKVFQGELGPQHCIATSVQDGLRFIIERLPKKVSNIGGCEDFAKVGY